MEYFSRRKKIIIFAVIVMTITLIPYIVGYAQQGDQWRYTGFVIGVEDGNSYIAKMLSGASGSWLFRSPHSAVEQKGVIAYLPYILLGKLSAGEAQHDQLVVLYHLARFLFGSLSILATYDFISVFIRNEKHKNWALVLISLGGGLGWILVAFSQKGFLGSLPLEFISPESFGFLGIFGFPHLAAARALFLWGFTLFINKDKGYFAGFLWLIMGFLQPMIGVIAWAVLGSYAAAVILIRYFTKDNLFDLNNGSIKLLITKAVQAVVLSAPIILYTSVIFLTDPYFKAWTVQNRFPSPHILHYAIAYGLALPFAISGIWKLIKLKKMESLMLAGWLIISPLLIYAPVVTQRRLAEGLWAVIIIGIFGNYTNSVRTPTTVKVLTVLLLPSTLFIYIGSILVVSNPSEPIFRRGNEVKAYEFMAQTAKKDEVVLSSFEIGNNLPAWAHVRVVMGHGPETIGLMGIETQINEYFSMEKSTWVCNDIATELNADYLFWGPVEKDKWEFDPGGMECLSQIYNQENYSIFKVNIQE